MSRGMPSMTALLGLLAIAGYQNRDKLAEMLKGAGGGGSSGAQPGGLLGNLGGMLGGAGVGGLLSGGINELLERFNQNGHGETAQSWINSGPNKDISPPQLKQAGRSRKARTADRTFAGRTACEAVPRATDGGRQIHARRTFARRLSCGETLLLERILK